MLIEISNLTITSLSYKNRVINIHHELFLSMIDVKTINVIENNTASSVCLNFISNINSYLITYYILIFFYLKHCYICNCGPRDMNNLNCSKSVLNNDNNDKLKYGLSPLHARIKLFEYLLNISYR